MTLENNTILDNTKKILNVENSIWVSASAGSGKTTILVKRLLKLLLNGVELAKVVCITYTKNGANEMKTRIYENLSKWAVLNDDDLTRELCEILLVSNIDKNQLKLARILFAKVIDNIEELKILTIHSFCQQILKKFPIEADIMPNFEILENAKDMIKKCTNNFLLNIHNYENFSSYISEIVKYKNEDEFYNLINDLLSKQQDLNFIQSFNYDYKTDLYEIFNLYKEDNEEDILDQFLNTATCIDIDYFLNNIYETMTENQKKSFSILKNWNNYEFKKNNYEEYMLVFLTGKFEKRKFNSELNKFSKINPDFSSDFLQEQDRVFDFYQNINNVKTINFSIFIMEICLKILELYKNEKKQRGVLDYDDLIIYTLKLLTNTEYSAWINYKLDNGIDHILLDEAQDTSKIQWSIIQQLTEEFFSGEGAKNINRTIFVVGDEKQSIFKFQGASPDMFSEKYVFYKNTVEYCHKFINKVDLEYSFRSLPAILNFVDNIFKDVNYASQISKINTNIKHNCIRTNENNQGLVELWPLVEVEEQNENENILFKFQNEVDVQNKEQLALYIALKIKDIVSSNKIIKIKNKEHKVSFKDIMVLIKKHDDIFLSYLIRKLNDFNIPNSGFDKINLLDNIIVQDFLTMLEFTVFNRDDFLFASLFKSPILNMSEEELFFLCRYKIDNGIDNLFESLVKFCDNYDNNTNKYIEILQENNFQNFTFNLDKYKKILLILNDFIVQSNNLNISSFLYYIINNYDIKMRFFERFNNNFIEIFNQFMNYVKIFESNNTMTIFNFLQKTKENNIEIKKDLNMNIDQVQIMTIHASKGLQSPIVFVINFQNNENNHKNSILWQENDFDYKLPIFDKFSTTEKFKEEKEKIAQVEYAEYLRLFYVAITRAENELYICGFKYGNSKKESEEKAENKKNWYDIANIVMKNIGEQKPFEYQNKLQKYVFGSSEFKISTINNYEKNNENNVIFNFEKLNDLQLKVEKEEDLQFLKHIDRDNNILSMNIAIIRGNAVHKLLEILPLTKQNERDAIADIYLNNSFFVLSPGDKQNIKQKVFNILNNPEYKIFFDNNSKSEVDIIGNIGEKNISCRIDRLIITEEKVIIIDYKNTKKFYNIAQQLPIEFINQLTTYKKLIEQIYTTQTIQCYILLTSYIHLIQVL